MAGWICCKARPPLGHVEHLLADDFSYGRAGRLVVDFGS